MIEVVVEDEVVKFEIFVEFDWVVIDLDVVLVLNIFSILIMKVVVVIK